MVKPANKMDIMNKAKLKQSTAAKSKAAPPQEVPKQTATIKSMVASPEDGLKQTAIVNNKLVSPKAGPQGLKEQLFRNQFKKTQLCHYHAAGKCKTGKACPFAHGGSELNIAPDLVKTSMCPLWMAAGCNKSAQDCKFAHGFEDMRMTPLFEVGLFANRIQKDTAGPVTSDINEVDTPPKSQKSKTNISLMSNIKSKSTTCPDSNQIDSPPSPDADQIDIRREAKTPPQAPLPKAVWVMPPAQQWLMSMKVFVTFASMQQQGELETMLQNAAPEQYYD